MADSVDGMKYVMSFEADTAKFEAAVTKMQNLISGLGKMKVNIGTSGGGGGGSGGGGGGGGRGSTSAMFPKPETYAQQEAGIKRVASAQRKYFSDMDAARKENERRDRAGSSGSSMFGPNPQTYAQKAAYQKQIARDSEKAAEADRKKQRESMKAERDQRRYLKEWDAAKKDNEKRSKGDGGGGDGFFGKASALIIGMELGKAQNFAQGMADAVWSAGEAVGALYNKTVEEAALFQDIQSGLKFAFGDNNYERVFENVKKEAAKTSFTLAETAELTRSLGMLKINPFEDAAGKALEFKGRTGEVVSMLEVFQDAASATGKSTKSVSVALREFMGGNDTSLARRLDIPLTKVHAWRKETKLAKDEQGQMNILVQKLADMYGGASAGKRENWNFLKDQIPDLMQQLYAGMGAGALKAMTPGLKVFMESLRQLVTDEGAVRSMGEAFTILGKGIGMAMTAGGGLIRLATTIIKMEPHIPLLVAGLTGMGGAAIFLTATTTSLGLGLAVVAAGIAAVGWEIAAIALVPTLIAGAAAAVLFGAGASLMVGAFMSARQKAGGFVETMTDAKVIIGAVWEAFSTWNDNVTTISKESYDNLQKRGLSGYFQDIIAWASRAEQFVKGFGKGFEAAFAPIAAKSGKAFDDLVDSVTRLLTALGLMAPAAETSMDSAGSAGERMGSRVAQALGLVTSAVDVVNTAFSSMFKDAPGIIRSFSTIYFVAKMIWNVFQSFLDVLGLVGLSIYATMVFPLQTVGHIVFGLLRALQAGMLAIGALAGDGDYASAKKSLDLAGENFTDIWDNAKGAIEFGENRVKGIGGNIADVADGYGQMKNMDQFANTLGTKLGEVDARRKEEDFAGARRDRMSNLDDPLNYTPLRAAPSTFSGAMMSPMSWGDSAVNPMTMNGEEVRKTQNLNLNLKVEGTVDGDKIMDITVSKSIDAETGQGNPFAGASGPRPF